jgi:hypothetical protein
MKIGRYRIKINVSPDGTIEITIEPIPSAEGVRLVSGGAL